MAFPANLTSNEVKDRAGVEQEFIRISTGPGRETLFAKSGEIPARPHRISVRHAETGSGLTRRRRSVLRVDLTHLGHVDNTKTVTTSAYVVLDAPVGNITTSNEATDCIANLIQMLATQGAAETTVRLDGTGYGAAALRYGEL
ncbi:TPA_asm: coat protein [ssRNA phage SRR5466338_4]|uniref:Coat protein n=1 Tax=ssRNA phage SRR5466338_4 TaxID=2786393 RepID=A0A8S5L3M4_9VIRU|nr:coat protein [ssRNA phage SRR5466338_4]DAD52366.1 TPA_asm: coat protein [ssRNA phage SRR5466338_4]